MTYLRINRKTISLNLGLDLQKHSREQDRGDRTKISDARKPNLLLQNKILDPQNKVLDPIGDGM